MNTIADSEDETTDENEIQPKSHVIEGSLRSAIDDLEKRVSFLERYQSMEPKHRLEGFGFRFLRWFRKDYQCERQRLETNLYLCNRISLVSAPIFLLSAVPPMDTGIAVLSGLITGASLLGSGMFGGALEDMRSEGERCECQ